MTQLRWAKAGCTVLLLGSFGCSATRNDEAPGRIEARVIYGTDDRQDPFNYADPAWAAQTLQFAAALVPTSQIDASNPNDIHIGDRTLQQRFNVCPDERFASQPAFADCSATLIDSDLVLTAGHCINVCDDSRFIFNYALRADGTLPPITSDDVYQCVGFLAYAQSPAGVDYALVRLSRPVTGRAPALVRRAITALPVGTPLSVAGFPSGLPLKIADNATVRENDAQAEFFRANLDTFVGNSGSGVFDTNSHELVGVLVRGDADYVQDGDCLRPNRCPDDGCRGEDVVYVHEALQAACTANDLSLCSCGDGACGPLESPASCPSDCSCGDGICSTGESPASCSVDCRFEVLFDDHNPQANWITPAIQVRNTGTDEVHVGGATVRYYFTQEPPGSMSADCWGCSVVPAVTFHEVPNGGCANATHYADVTLPDVWLPPSGTTEQFKLAFHASSWQAFDPSNDYSYGSINWDYAPNSRITMYRLGVHVFGDEPCPGLFIPPAH